MGKIIGIICFLMIFIILTRCRNDNSQQNQITMYLGQSAPGTDPVVFGQDFLPPNNRDVAFTPDGKEFYFTQVKNNTYTIMFSKYADNRWTIPTTASFSGVYNDFEPCISHDGQKFYFASMRPSKVKKEMINDIDIWVMNRKGYSWSEPKLLDVKINTACMEYYPSITENGTLYFGRNDSAMIRGDINYSRFVQGRFTKPEKLPQVVNLPESSFNAFIAQDESYIIFCSYVQVGQTFHSDLYISFRDKKGIWSESQNLGQSINSRGNEISPYVSRDGKYLFFASTRLDSTSKNMKYDIFWVNADVIERKRMNNKMPPG